MDEKWDVDSIKNEQEQLSRTNAKWMIIETANGYEVHQHTADSVFPPTLYRNKRDAAARVLQLLGIGPVGPQSYAEKICLGKIFSEDRAEG